MKFVLIKLFLSNKKHHINPQFSCTEVAFYSGNNGLYVIEMQQWIISFLWLAKINQNTFSFCFYFVWKFSSTFLIYLAICKHRLFNIFKKKRLLRIGHKMPLWISIFDQSQTLIELEYHFPPPSKTF